MKILYFSKASLTARFFALKLDFAVLRFQLKKLNLLRHNTPF